MPKYVDHQSRREEIAGAVWRLVARGGIREATVRAVAAESGWSMGAVRYYFTTQAELLVFAAEVMRDRVVARMRAIVATRPPGPERAAALVEQMLPLDGERLVEVTVWLACMTGRDPEFDELRAFSWVGERHVCRIAVSDILGTPSPADPSQRLSEEGERRVDALHVLLDGLSVMGTTYRAHAGPQWLRARLQEHLESVGAGPHG